jgi:hypothetical protein
MIAPTGFTNELKLYLYLTEPVIENFGFQEADLPKGSDLNLPRDWWSVWRCEILITDPDGEYNVVVFTNADTLLSFICPGQANDFDGMIQEFERHFLSHLEIHGLKLPEHVSTELVAMVGEPEELSDDAWWLVDCAQKDLVERKLAPTEAQINLHTNPISEVSGESASYFFLEALKKNPPFGADFNLPDDEVPF